MPNATTSDHQLTTDRFPPRRLTHMLIGAALFAIAALIFVRGMTYRTTTSWATTLPDGVQTAFLVVSEYGLLVLVALFGVGAMVARHRGVDQLARGVAAGVGVVIAYLLSEGIKLAASELRPCRNFAVPTIASCPPATDWAWPSNHATIAMSIAVAVVIMVRSLGLLSIPIAMLIAVSRVVVGVHYFHDVIAGALLGALVVTLCARWGAPLCARTLRAIAGRHPVLDKLITDGPTRRSVTRSSQSSTTPHHGSEWWVNPAR